MECKQAQQQIEPYFDGELPLSDKRAVEEHLERCSECAGLLAALQAVNTVVRQRAVFRAPATLRRRLRRHLSQTGETSGRDWLSWFSFGSATLALVAVAVVTWGSLSFPFMRADRTLLDEVLSAHVRSLMVDHATDIASSDGHTVKPWFQGKLNFSPPVQDYSGQGFPLLGGRLEYLKQRPAAALVYRRRAHVINLLVWPSQEHHNAEPSALSLQGYQVVRWSHQGLAYLLVSDLNASELSAFAALIRDKEATEVNG